MEKDIKIKSFSFTHGINDEIVNEFCEGHEIVQIHPPIVVPSAIYTDGRICRSKVILSVVYYEKKKRYHMKK